MKIGSKLRKGYTVVELIIVLAFLGVFSTVLLVVFLLIKILWKFAFAG
jgi:Tfp pilus assembly protein PilE